MFLAGFMSSYYFCRPPTPKEIALAGLQSKRSVELELVEVTGKGFGVNAVCDIPCRAFVTEYKYHALHTTRAAKLEAENEYVENDEGCYILEAH